MEEAACRIRKIDCPRADDAIDLERHVMIGRRIARIEDPITIGVIC